MQGRTFTLEALGFAFKSLIDHVRLFVVVLLVGSGLVSLVVGIVAFLNKGFINAVMASEALKNYQECVGYGCAKVAYDSGQVVRMLITNHFFSLLISAVVLAIFFAALDLGFKKIALNLYDNNESSYKQLFSCFALSPRAVAAWILYAVMVWVGWLLLILPGFIALLRFIFFPYFIIDKNVGPVVALKMSYEVTADHMWDIFAFWVAIKVISSLAFVSWFGVLLSWPLCTLAYASLYRKLVVAEKSGFEFFKSAV